MRQDHLIQHIWARHKYGLIARSRSSYERVNAMVSSDPPRVTEALDLMSQTLASPPSRSGWGDALDLAWRELGENRKKHDLSKDKFANACKKGREEARLYLFTIAVETGDDGLVGSSLLDDNPMPGFAFFKKGSDWWQVREKNGRLSCLPLTGLLSRASSSARRDAVLHGEGILRRIAGNYYPDPRFVPVLRSKGLWSEAWLSPKSGTA
ncbi:MAG: hypothetical protein E2P00_05810 [Acidobacteria bacterium]|nr:MAG: hypothetical protein E2P00_05810 [Acidobacteriota bacterium]